MLGFRYLWIDPLCIIEDSLSDWLHEAGRMAPVYRNADLTIAAPASSGSQGGLFFGPSPTTHIALDRHSTLHTRFERDFKDEVICSPLASYGWTLQEAVLSRRVVHFASGQRYSECAAPQASEDGCLGGKSDEGRLWVTTPKMLSSPTSAEDVENVGYSSKELRRIWDAVAETYSGRRLKFLSDKLAALAGITQQTQALLGDEPIVGLWKASVRLSASS